MTEKVNVNSQFCHFELTRITHSPSCWKRKLEELKIDDVNGTFAEHKV